jgi:uncharacterized protein (TIGR00730 family)
MLDTVVDGIEIIKDKYKVLYENKEEVFDTFIEQNKEEGIRVFVAGGSRAGNDTIYEEEAYNLGRQIIKMDFKLDFGLSNKGIMGAVARGVHHEGGVKIVGIVPDFFIEDGKHVDGILFNEIDEYIETDTMRERKKLLDEMSDGFIITPGGVGTYDELFEMLTLKNLGQHKKPMAVLNTNGYYNNLLNVLEDGIKAGFIKEKVKGLLFVSESAEEILQFIEQNA